MKYESVSRQFLRKKTRFFVEKELYFVMKNNFCKFSFENN